MKLSSKGYLCSKTVFELSKKVHPETEIKILEKGLDFAPIQKTLNEPELRKDFEEFSRRMWCDVSGTFVMKSLKISVTHQPLDLNLYGNHQKNMRF